MRLVTRNGQDWTGAPARHRAGRSPATPQTAVLDGELVALRENGISNFADLQAALSTGRDRALFFYAFDLLHLEGWDLRPAGWMTARRAARPVGLGRRAALQR